MKKLTKYMSSLSLVLVIASCGVESVVDYTPVVDNYNTSMTALGSGGGGGITMPSPTNAQYNADMDQLLGRNQLAY